MTWYCINGQNTNKCLEILETNQFTKLNHNPTKSVEVKIQRLLRKPKSRMSQKQYYQLYPTGPCAEKFYGATKIHKLPPDGNKSKLPLRPIISNIGTASYQLAKYLTQLLSSLTQSRYTVNSMKDLIVKIKTVLFDVKSFFTSVLLEYTIDITMK